MKKKANTFYDDLFDPVDGDPVLWEDNLIKAHKKILNRRKRAKAYQEHLEHTRVRRDRIAKILGVPVSDVEELLQLLKHELKYVSDEGKKSQGSTT